MNIQVWCLPKSATAKGIHRRRLDAPRLRGWCDSTRLLCVVALTVAGCAQGCVAAAGGDAYRAPVDVTTVGVDGGAIVGPATVSERTCVTGVVQPNAPNLFIHDSRLFLFANIQDRGDPATTELVQYRSDVAALSFDSPVHVTNDAYHVDFIDAGSELWVVAAGGFVASTLLGSVDAGESWSQRHVFSAGEASGSCQYAVPSYFVRPLATDPQIALGYNQVNAVLGCSSRTHRVQRESGVWTASAEILRGTPAGAFNLGDWEVFASARGVAFSTDGGQSFATLPSGDSTQDQLRGERLARDDAGVLYLAQTYNYANIETLALLVSRDDGESWVEKWILYQGSSADISLASPSISATGGRITVSWRQANGRVILGSYLRYSALAMMSDDGGASWSAPVQIDDAGAMENVSSVTAVVDGSHVFAAYAVTGEDIFWDHLDVCVVRLTAP